MLMVHGYNIMVGLRLCTHNYYFRKHMSADSVYLS